MSWGLWLGLLAAIAGATVWLVTFYTWWSLRFDPRLKTLGVWAEWAFLAMIVGLGVAGACFLWGYAPWTRH